MQEVIDQYKILHVTKKWFPGKLKEEQVNRITRLIQETGSISLLDYGSGKGKQYLERKQHENWGGLVPVCYDPGYEPYSLKPTTKFDGVICTDVAEHIPEESIDEFLADVIGYATKFVFFSIGLNISRKTFPDGRSVHLTVKPEQWWLDTISQVSTDVRVETMFSD